MCLVSGCPVYMVRHGDDFVVSDTRTQHKEFEEQLSKHLIDKHLATLGPCTALGDVTHVRTPYRTARWVQPLEGLGRERIEYEADPRHAELDHTPTWTSRIVPRRVRSRNLELT